MHSIFDLGHLKSKIAVLENMLKGFSVQALQISQTSMVSYSLCQALDHSLSTCPYSTHWLSTS